jgi:hypothetical protein
MLAPLHLVVLIWIPPQLNQIDCSRPQIAQFSFAAGMWELLCARPELRVLLAGPTGSGKTTVGELIKRSVNPKGPHIDLENVVTPTIGMNVVRARLGAADMTVMDVGGTVSALLCFVQQVPTTSLGCGEHAILVTHSPAPGCCRCARCGRAT